VKRYAYPLAVVVAAAVVGASAASVGGRSSTPFLVGATLALGWIVWLLFRAAAALVREPDVGDTIVATGRRRKELEREKQSLLKALKELDFDHEMGKVSQKDFDDISALYRARAIRVLRRLDEAGGDYERMIAVDVAKRLQKSGGAATPIASAATATTTAAEALGSDGCPKCQTRNDADAEFCKKCGSKLHNSEAAS
jgi:ribosomal protein L40E